MKPFKVKKERDRRLMKDYQSGKYTVLELAFKYKITPQRIQQLRKKYGVPPLKVIILKDKPYENISGEDNRL